MNNGQKILMELAKKFAHYRDSAGGTPGMHEEFEEKVRKEFSRLSAQERLDILRAIGMEIEVQVDGAISSYCASLAIEYMVLLNFLSIFLIEPSTPTNSVHLPAEPDPTDV